MVDRLSDDRSCTQWRAISEIAPRLGTSVGSLRRWYEQHLVNTGERQGMTREEHEEVKRLLLVVIAAKSRPASARSVCDQILTRELATIHAHNFGVYGKRKMWHAARHSGWKVGL